MTTPSAPLHPTPGWPVVVREQIRAVGVAIRTEAAIFVVATIVLSVLLLVEISRAPAEPPVAGTSPAGGAQTEMVAMQVEATVTVEPLAFPLALVGLLLPLAVWRREEPSRRAYHWAMPVPRRTHTLAKVFAGWLWLLGAVTLLLLVLTVNGAVVALLRGEALSAIRSAPPYVSCLAGTGAATVAYLLGSTAVLASDHPMRWIGGVLMAHFAAAAVLATLGWERVHETLWLVVDGHYGLDPVLFGGLWPWQEVTQPGAPPPPPDLARWAVATALWGALGMAGVLAAAHRRR